MPARTVSAPGSLMLLGEHAVLHGHRALVCAINRRITVHLTPLEVKELRIDSGLGSYESPLTNLMEHPALRFVIQAVRQYVEELPSGLSLRIASDFPADIGFGSSAAVTVAVHAAILDWVRGDPPDDRMVFEQAMETVHKVQGRGSGADLAASVFGGIVAYNTKPSFEYLPISIPITAVYCGYKTPTPDVIQKVELFRARAPDKYARIYSDIHESVDEAVDCLRIHAWPAYGQIMNRNQHLMDAMGVNTPELQEIVETLQASPDIFGAKISGSGLGDCVVGIGYADLKDMDYPVYHLEITPTGIEYHERRAS